MLELGAFGRGLRGGRRGPEGGMFALLGIGGLSGVR